MDCAQFEEIVHDLERPGTEGFVLRDSALAHAESCDHCARLMHRRLPAHILEPEEIERAISALGAAAAVLLVLGISLHRWIAPNRNIAPVRGVAGNTSPVASPVAIPANSQRQDQESGSDADDSEYATAFVPLPYADDPTAVDGGTVVRVILSRPALASLGVPVTDPSATDRIPADLLLGEDGTPQAIRLVSQSQVDE